MISIKTTRPWSRFAGEMIVPVLFLGYATQYYVSVARLPGPDTNLLLIGPVYWLLLVCCVSYAALRLADTVRAQQSETAELEEPPQKFDLTKSVAFLILTGVCIWSIPVLGFVTSTLTYIFLMLLVLGVRSVPLLVLTPTILVGLIWIGMEHYLKLPLPTGHLI
ncbi:MAG: tripartite tricarboxylate transporter TctB family protein [Pseudolabrys sp.]|nr:tripartite tricarboxylate transporter TctB family protein [Pseudolabrys sp.]MDP2298489.1 tripartite tricarboxylate transporter TctB family protein [Pseudolabrys sp.]